MSRLAESIDAEKKKELARTNGEEAGEKKILDRIKKI